MDTKGNHANVITQKRGLNIAQLINIMTHNANVDHRYA